MTVRIASAALLASALCLAQPAHAARTTLSTFSGSFGVPIISLKEARFRSVVRQQYDFSCGSAALATLLTYHYGRPTTEEEAFRTMWEVGDQEAIKRQGFSLADMQRYLASKGLKSDGFKVTLDKLAEVGVPAVTLIDTKGYAHFVVVKGIRGGDVLVGDPALGLKAIPKDQFQAMWRGVIFAIRDEAAMGREHFNDETEWSLRRKAPFGTALGRRGLATFSTMMPGLFEF